MIAPQVGNTRGVLSLRKGPGGAIMKSRRKLTTEELRQKTSLAPISKESSLPSVNRDKSENSKRKKSMDRSSAHLEGSKIATPDAMSKS